MTHFIHIPGLDLNAREYIPALPYNREVSGNCTVLQSTEESRETRERMQITLATAGIVFWVHEEEVLTLSNHQSTACFFCSLERTATPAL